MGGTVADSATEVLELLASSLMTFWSSATALPASSRAALAAEARLNFMVKLCQRLGDGESGDRTGMAGGGREDGWPPLGTRGQIKVYGQWMLTPRAGGERERRQKFFGGGRLVNLNKVGRCKSD